MSMPKRLCKEPLVEALFEMRLPERTSAPDLLPGFLLSQGLKGKITHLPHSQIPRDVRAQDPNLRFAPLLSMRLEDDFVLSIGESVLSLSCLLPYKGWQLFSEKIVHIVNLLRKSEIVEKANRFSLKYANIIDESFESNQKNLINGSFNIAGERDLTNLQFRGEFPTEKFIHVIDCATNASANIKESGILKKGLLVAVDSIFIFREASFSDLLNNFQNDLDSLHMENKEMFFACLKDETIELLEPEYDD